MNTHLRPLAAAIRGREAVVAIGPHEHKNSRRMHVGLRSMDRFPPVVSPLALLTLWEILARLGVIDTRFFPAPTSIFRALWQMLQPTDQFPQGEL
jgi:hypothetical protein